MHPLEYWPSAGLLYAGQNQNSPKGTIKRPEEGRLNSLTTMAVTMSSLAIAELTGKRHDNVKRTIASLEKAGVVHPQIEDEDSEDAVGRVRTIRVYQVSKRDSFVIVAQLSPEFTAALVDRWQELEAQQQVALPKTFAEALRLAADQQECIERQAAALVLAAPKVEFVDRYVESSGSKGFRQVAKLLGAKENEFRAFLTERRIMYRLGNEWVPYQPHIEAGRFEMKTGTGDNDHTFNQARFTPKGIAWVSQLWAKRKEPALG